MLLVLTVAALALVGSAAGAPSAAAGDATTVQADSTADVTVEELDGQSVWQGEELAVDGFHANETVRLDHVDDFVQTTADDGGVAVIDTSSLSTGEWTVAGVDSGASGEFTVREQQFTRFEFVRDSGEEYLAVDSNRASYEIALSADGLGASQLDAAFDDGTVQGDALVLQTDDSVFADQRFYVDTDELPIGHYELTGSVPDSTATGSAVLSLERADADVSAAVGDLEGRPVWRGQQLAVGGFHANETVRFDHADDFVQATADDDGVVVIDTTSLSTGEWIVDGLVSGDGEFTLREQAIGTFEVEPSVTDGAATVTVDSNRAYYDVRLASDSISAEEFDDAFERGTIRDGAYVLPGDGEYAADFGGLSLGAHEITADVTDAAADASTTFEVASGPEASAEFGFDSRTEQVGDVVEFEIEIETQMQPDEVWVTITDDRGLYDVTFSVTNVDDYSEPIEVTWNTHEATDAAADAGISVDNGELGSITTQGGPSGDYFGVDHLNNAEHTFELTSYTNSRDVADDRFDDVAFVDVEERSTDGLNLWRAPGTADVPSDEEDLDELLEGASRAHTVSNEDLLIAEVQASGVYGYLNETPAGFDTDGLSLTFEGPPDFFGNSETVAVGEMDSSAASIVARPDEDTFYVVVEPGAIGDADDLPEEWTAEFSIDGAENPYVAADDSENGSGIVDLEDGDIEIRGEFVGEDLVLHPNESATIHTETNLAPGTPVDLRVNLPEDFRTASTEVSADGTLAASVDLSEAEPGDQLTLIRYRTPSGVIDQTRGVVASPDGPTFLVETSAPGQAAVGTDANLSVEVVNAGAGAGTADLTVRAEGDAVAERTVDLGPGEIMKETIRLPVDEPGALNWSVVTQDDEASGTIAGYEYVELDGYEPRPYEGSELYYDVTGDGSVGQTDVVTFFRHQHRDAWKQPDRFDFTGDGTVGHGDVVELFEVVATGVLDDPFGDIDFR